MIIVRAPLRISLGGGGTDLPFYSSKFGGSMVSAAIDKYIYIIIEKRNFYDEILVRYSKTEKVKKIEDLEHSRVREALKLLNITEPLEITSLSDVPAGTGLGSSGAFLVALLKALHAYKREDASAKKLAEEAAHIEMEILKEPIGKQDQYMSSFGGVLNLEIDKKGNVMVSPLNASYSTLEEIENNILMFKIGETRSASDILNNQAKEAESEQNKMDQMHLIKDIGKEIKNALEKGDTKKFGQWLNVHWESKKNFGKMSSPKIDKAYEIALQNGALGGKIVGAGGGGFLMVFCENKKEKLREALENLGLREMPIKFDSEGCKIIYHGR